ncbi:MAG: peptidase C25 [Thermoplasmata archaeon]|nr:MAG: peptidase C25 [Thermoplasmata archaeon]
MKKFIVLGIVCVFLFGGGIAGLKSVDNINDGITKTHEKNIIEKLFEFSMPEIKESDGYVIVGIEGTKQIMHQGKPILPYKVDVTRFPIGTKINVEAEEGEVKEMKLDSKIKPYPMFTMATMHGKVIVKEGEIYEEDKAFPENWVECRKTVGLYNGERVVTLSLFIYPCRYLPRENTLLYTNSIRVKINYELPSEPVIKADEYDLLIICPDEWKDSLQALKEHKENHGLKTVIAGLSEIYGGNYFSVSGRDDAEKVKYFIKNAIEQWGIKYVMLVGGRHGGLLKEKWWVPVRYSHLYDGSGGEVKAEYAYLCDLYFSDIYKYEDGMPVFDDWDSNGNGIFAEWKTLQKDKLDLNPDVYVGRLACRNEKEVNIMVNKIIEYENSNAKNQEWFKRMVVVAGDTFPPEDDPYYEGELSTAKALEYMEGFEAVKLWTSLGTLNSPKDVMNAIENGCGFLDFEGHGNPMGWATHPPHDEETWIDGLKIGNMPMLSNKGMYPVCVVGGCHNSQFNVTLLNLLKIYEGKEWLEYIYWGETGPECWSWWLTRKIDGGAIATIGCTGYGYGAIGDGNGDGIPDCIQAYGGWIDIEFFRVYGQEGKDMLGEVHSTAISNYVTTFPVMKDNIDCKTVQEWVLLGDPSLKIGGY